MGPPRGKTDSKLIGIGNVEFLQNPNLVNQRTLRVLFVDIFSLTPS